jgi:uncharacterized protein (DUF3084 family)
LDLLPLAFLILFVVLGGVIAVIADNVGRTLGKKKLRLGKLRPRHTAMVGTFIVGALISIFTIMLVTLSSSDVRKWILEGQAALRQRDESLKNLTKVQSDLANQEKEYAKLDKDYRSKAAQVNKQASRLNTLQTQIGKLSPQIARLQGAVAIADKKVSALDAERIKTQRTLLDKQAILAKAQRDLVKVQKDVKLQQSLAIAAGQANEETGRRNQELTHANEELEHNINSLTSEIAKLTADTHNLEQARDKAQQELTDAQTNLADYQTRLTQAQADLQQVTQEYQRMSLQLQRLSGITDQTRYGPIIYQVGEEVLRVQANGGQSVDQANDSLTGLLRGARIAAAARGAKANGNSPEAGIFEHADPQTKRVISVEEIHRRIINQIAGSDVPIVIIASSTVNTFRGEPVSLEVDVFPNPMVYLRGVVIAESRVDGSKDEDSVLAQLEDLISTKVRERAKADKMVPTMGSGQIGEVSPTDVFKLMERVKTADRLVRVQATAAQDTRAGDPLKLEFRLR